MGLSDDYGTMILALEDGLIFWWFLPCALSQSFSIEQQFKIRLDFWGSLCCNLASDRNVNVNMM